MKFCFNKNMNLSKEHYEYLIYILNCHSYDYENYKSKSFKNINQIIKLYFKILQLSNIDLENILVSNFIKKDMNVIIYFIGIKRSIEVGIFKYFKINLYILFFLKSCVRKFF